MGIPVIVEQTCILTIMSGQMPATIPWTMITTPPKMKVKAQQLGVYSGTIHITIPPGTLTIGAFVQIAPADIDIVITATKVKASSELVNQENEEGTDPAVDFLDASVPVTTPFPVTVKITFAGQTKVNAV